MSNQWGRETRATQGGGPGFSGILVAIVVSLLIGASAGYLYVRFTQPDQSAQLEQVRQQVASLEQQQVEASRRAAEAEKALDRARAAKPSQNADTAALNDRISALRTELDGMVQALAAASDKEQQATEAADMLSQEFATDRADLLNQVRELEDSAAASAKQRQALEQQLAAARGMVAATQTSNQDELVTLKARLENGDAERATLQKDLAQAVSDREAAVRDLAAARSEMATLKARIAAQDQQLAALETQLATAAADAAKSTEPSSPLAPEIADVPPAASPVPPPAPPSQTPLPERDAARVDQVMASVPGLDRLVPADLQRLRQMLVSGQCVTTGLEAVFSRVPVITLRNLMRDLNSDC